MYKSKSAITFEEYKNSLIEKTQNFGNDWGLFIEIDDNNTKNTKYKTIKNNLETINETNEMYDSDNCDENYDYYDVESNVKRVKQRENVMANIIAYIKLFITAIASSILTYIIFYKGR